MNHKIKNILVTGGGGYIGTNLVRNLLEEGYKVRVIDTFWFGDHLKKNKNLKILKKDMRNIAEKDLELVELLFETVLGRELYGKLKIYQYSISIFRS